MKINSASHSVGISRQIFQTALLFVCLFFEVDNRNRRRRFEFGSEIRTCPLPPPPSLLPKVSVAWWRPKNIQIIIFEQNSKTTNEIKSKKQNKNKQSSSPNEFKRIVISFFFNSSYRWYSARFYLELGNQRWKRDPMCKTNNKAVVTAPTLSFLEH